MKTGAGSARAFVAAIALTMLLGRSKPAHAGGMEIPDHGTEALGRGGAFTAKADDPSALHHNVAGLAQQRGTRFLLNANIARSSLAFQRAGTYPGTPGDPATPWAGRSFPRAENQGGLVALPVVAITSDFGLPWATFALGTFPPSTIGGRVYPLVQDGAPSPVRYDSVGGVSSLVLFHTAAAAFHVSDEIDIGAAVHLVQTNIGVRMVSYQTIGNCSDVTREDPGCDARGEAMTKGWSATGSLAVMVRPASGVTLGAQFRGPVYMNTSGEAKLSAPTAFAGTKLDDTGVEVAARLPWTLRTGIRKAFGPDAALDHSSRRTQSPPSETGDLELDFIYEAWGSAMNPGPKVMLEQVLQKRLIKTVQENYNDTFSVRLGGSMTTDAIADTPVTFRGGFYYDKSATEERFTRLDNDTLDKVAGTIGVGVRVGAVKLDVAYASVFDISRVVKEGALRSTDDPNAPVVNSGVFSGHTHIASLGASIELDRLIGRPTLPSSPTRGNKRPNKLATRQ